MGVHAIVTWLNHRRAEGGVHAIVTWLNYRRAEGGGSCYIYKFTWLQNTQFGGFSKEIKIGKIWQYLSVF